MKKKTGLSVDVVTKHILSQEHVKLSDKEKKTILEKYNATIREFPKIRTTDPAIAHLGVKGGDLVKVIRKSKTSGTSEFYRGVIDG